jgi:hypothetical protein
MGRAERNPSRVFPSGRFDDGFRCALPILQATTATRPGRIRETVAIALPRLRPLAIKRAAEFVACVDRIWRLIEDDVRASVIEEHA